ncbi:MAG: glycerate kinase [Xanthobacteraceae bacterium]|nr:glycerate kinase [Xanthobacteraceae bacterium]MBV9630186.1 glycerate kinase [Xanthobacteraceae bacterium]
MFQPEFRRVIQRPREFLTDLFDTAVAAVHPAACLAQFLPPLPIGRLVVCAAGKAAGSMAEVTERYYLDQLGVAPARLDGVAVTRRGYGRPTRRIELIEAGHPVPDAAGLTGATKMLALVDSAGPQDLVLVLMSGGASANLIAPATGVTLAEKQALTRQLLKSGATIGEINTVRKHLSAIKGGRLAARAYPAPVVTLAISDVPGDDPAVIGSGPTVADPTTLADARAVAARFRLALSPAITRALADAASESPKPGDARLKGTTFHIVARPADALSAAAARIKGAGYECLLLGDSIEGEAREVAQSHAKLARELHASGRRAVILSGGELTVTIRGQGQGGPNQEYALALVTELDGIAGLAAIAGDTDGTDGGSGEPDDPAGAFVAADSAARARALGLDPALFLADNNSRGFFSSLGDLLQPGPTYTNVNDFRAILVDRP